LSVMIESIRAAVTESLELKRSFFAANEERIVTLAKTVCSALEGGRKLLLCGNGGSAADAQHIAAEWVGRFSRERRPLPAIALTTDTSILTCIGNDYGFEQVFARQIKALGRPGDVAIGISTSGNSPNVLHATIVARELGLVTVGFTGKDGGELGRIVQHHINVPHPSTARVQEIHIMVGHILCELADIHMKGL
jgi:D-sedoheptulose 7-phosphate isomerase